jgi:hypothetical protein
MLILEINNLNLKYEIKHGLRLMVSDFFDFFLCCCFPKSLHTFHLQFLQVVNFATTPGSNVGDHFASVMFRIVATISDAKSGLNEEIRLVLKTMPFVEGVKMDFLRETSLFDVEIKMYAEILPKMKPLLEACGIQSFWPK